MGSTLAILLVACGPILVVCLAYRGLGHREAQRQARKLFKLGERRGV